MLVVIATVKAKAGKEQELAALLKGFLAPTRRESGCIQYDLHMDQIDPGSFAFYERWADDAALNAHLRTPHMISGFASMALLTAGPASIAKYRIVS